MQPAAQRKQLARSLLLKVNPLPTRGRGDEDSYCLYNTILLTIGWNICPTVGFLPSSQLALYGRAVNGWAPWSCEAIVTHQLMTRNAIKSGDYDVVRKDTGPG